MDEIVVIFPWLQILAIDQNFVIGIASRQLMVWIIFKTMKTTFLIFFLPPQIQGRPDRGAQSELLSLSCHTQVAKPTVHSACASAHKSTQCANKFIYGAMPSTGEESTRIFWVVGGQDGSRAAQVQKATTHEDDVHTETVEPGGCGLFFFAG